jgi:hypothetical protein
MTYRFLDTLVLSPLSNGENWYLDRSFRYETGVPVGSGSGSSPILIHVPERFITDFASVPSLLAAVLPRWGKYGPAAIIHDWLYWEQPDAFPKERADEVFLEAMKLLGVGPIRTWALYNGVKLFGRMAWNENRRMRAQGISRIQPPGTLWPADLLYERFRFTRPGTWRSGFRAGQKP